MSSTHETAEPEAGAEAAAASSPLTVPNGLAALDGLGRSGLPAALRTGSGLRPQTVLQLQRACGNAAVNRIVSTLVANGAERRHASRVLARALDDLAPSWVEQEQQRRAELEKAETGTGRTATLQRLAAMSDRDARKQAPSIAYRAQDRGDVGLAVAASGRLLQAWLASADRPDTFDSAFGPDDAVDTVVERAGRALRAGQIELAGNYLGVSMVQLVRAANDAVAHRSTTDNAALEDFGSLFDSMQRSLETGIRQRIDVVRQLISTYGRGVAQRGDPAETARYEAMMKAVESAEHRAGPRIAEDLGDVGEPDIPSAHARAGKGKPSPPPPPPRSTPAAPVSRAPEAIVNTQHPDLEGALVVISPAPRKYGNIRSPRYGIAGTLAGAHRMANELFGQRSSVIVEDTEATDEHTHARQARYLVLAISLRLTAPTLAAGEDNGLFGIKGFEMLLQPAKRRYYFLSVASGPWLFFSPTLLDHMKQIRKVEAEERAEGIEAPTLTPETRRDAMFGPVDKLIAAGETQDAANALTYIGADGFSLVDTPTKTLYIATLLKAFTLEAHEKTVVEIFRTVRGAAELREVLYGLNRAGVINKLHSDMESAFSSLLIVVGESVGAKALTSEQVRHLLAEMKLFSPFRMIEVSGDGTIALTNAAAEIKTAFEQLITTITSMVSGVLDILLDPQTFAKGLYKMGYFCLMADLAAKGYPDAVRYVNTVIDAIAREIGAAARGLAALQENMPPGVEFVRDLQRSIEWRIIWEVLSLFIGIGEVEAFVDAIKSGKAGAALAEMADALKLTRPAAGTAGALDEASEAGKLGSAAGREARELAGDAARTGKAGGEATREVANGARIRYRAGGRRTLCINPCADLNHLSLGDDVIEAALRNISPEKTKELVEILAAYKSPKEVKTAEDLVKELSRGGEDAAAATRRLDEIAAIKRGADVVPSSAAGAAGHAPPAGGGTAGAAAHPTPHPGPATPPRISAPPAHQYVVDPRTAGTGGIRSIDIQLTARNEAQVTISGRVLPRLEERGGLESKLVPPREIEGLTGYDRAHLWARTLGDEAAEGVMYAPKTANVGMQEALEHQIEEMAKHAAADQHVVVRARATSYPRTQGSGALLHRAEYDITLVNDAGEVIERTGIVMEIPLPERLATEGIPKPRIVPGGVIGPR